MHPGEGEEGRRVHPGGVRREGRCELEEDLLHTVAEKEESAMKVKMFAVDVRKEKLKLDDAHKKEKSVQNNGDTCHYY